jgi:sugar phosphate isomerase/epimerase
MAYLSVSTWSLHRLIGPLRWTVWNPETATHEIRIEEQPEQFTLLELPALAAARGYQAVEVGHFHFPSTDPEYLAQLGQAFVDAGVSFDTLLLDYGDLTDTDTDRQAADVAYMRRWIDITAQAGAKQIRIVAGEALPTDEDALRQSAAALAGLAEYAVTLNVHVITENFKSLTSTAESALKLLQFAGPEVGFITDLGNYKSARKVDEIGETASLSVSVHVKPDYNAEGIPNEATLKQYMEQVQQSGFDGACVLIYDGPGDMWAGLARVQSLIQPYIAR